MDENRLYSAAFGLDETSGACRSSEERMRRKKRRAGCRRRRGKEENQLQLESVAMGFINICNTKKAIRNKHCLNTACFKPPTTDTNLHCLYGVQFKQ